MDGKLVIVGFGNMGQALIKGLLARNTWPGDISVVDVSDTAAEHAEKLQLRHVTDANDISRAPKVVLFAVKPQIAPDVVAQYARFAKEGTVFVSIMAGTTIGNLQSWLGTDAKVVRTMPNTPAAIGKGMSVLCAAPTVNDEEKELAESLLKAVGEVAWVDDEDDMNAVTALSGSGPAWFFSLMEAMEEAGVEMGLPQDVARKLTVNTAWGAGALARKVAKDTPPAQLRKNVTSPGGTTEAGLNVLSSYKFKDSVKDALKQAQARSRELSK